MRIGRFAAILALALAGAATAAEPQQSGFEDPAAATAPAAAKETAAASDAAQTAVKPGSVDAGAGKAAVCGACHGADGNSSDPQYPKLAGQHERYVARHLALFKAGERQNPVMLGFVAALSEQDMHDLGAYFASKQALPGVADDSKIAGTEESFAQRGERLYRGGNRETAQPACMACHGPTGHGNPGPSYPSLAGQHAGYTKALLKRFRSGESFGKDERANTVMAEVAAKLSDQDIEALASYIEGLHRAMPAEAAPAAKVAGK
jgi:cytochrome c553